MFKLFFFACVMAVVAAKPSIIATAPVAYTSHAYSPIEAYSPITYSAYTAPIATYSAYSYAPHDVYYLRR